MFFIEIECQILYNNGAMKILRRYLGGVHINDALKDVKGYNDSGVACSISYLSILKNNPESVEQEVNVYFEILNAINQSKVNCDVTLKLHQFGVYGKKEGLAEESVARIVQYAKSMNNFVWIDMELPGTVDRTIELACDLHQRYPGSSGVCLQAYLKRTESDLKFLSSKGLPIRFVKGFYKGYDFKSWNEVTENYRQLMTHILDHSSKPAIATHDLALYEEAKRYILENNLKHKVEFQFFKGVRDDLARELAREGFQVRIYIPFGSFPRFILHGLHTFDLWHQIRRLLGFAPES